MEIQKIFSNVEDPSENLYSVLMNEEELYLFSELQKEFGDNSIKDKRKENEYLGDRKDILVKAHGKPTNKFNDRSKKDEDYQEFYETGKLRTRRKVKNAAELGSLAGAYGGIQGYLHGRSKKSTAIGAAIGTAAGAGLSYGISKFGEKFAKKKLSEDPHYYDVDKEYLKYKHGNSTKKKVEKKIREEYKRESNKK